jgi:hypothetical protein
VAQHGEDTGSKDDFPECFDPYLRYAIAAEFKNFASFDDKQFKLFFLVEFKSAASAHSFKREMKGRIDFGPGIGLGRYATLRTDTAAVTDPRTFEIWKRYVSKLELSLPILSSGPTVRRRRLRPRWKEGKDPPGSLLIGMLDDGCPFAAAHFLRSPASTRVRSIWDQNRYRSPIEVKDSSGSSRHFGQKLTDFDYGLEFRRDFAPALRKEEDIGLDDWIELHSGAGSIDEDGCYADAGFTSLAHHHSHGAHVMDVLAGRMPTSSRIALSPPCKGQGDPPSWQEGSDPACAADLVFVQFSDECIRDATGIWLKAYVFDGIRYILSFADPASTEKVIINISYGPTTGPHDGTAGLEKALRAFVKKFNGKPGKPKLEIVLPAGNAYLSEGHAAFTRRAKQPNYIEWTWRLPPDNSVLCFAEVWINRARPGSVTVTLTSPSGVTWTSSPGLNPPPRDTPLPPDTGVYAPGGWGSHTRWLLAVEPTRVATDDTAWVAAEHGDWKIKVSGIPGNAQIHAYVARSDPNMGVRTGAKLSYFVDHDWERTRSSEASCKYGNGEFDRAGSLIHRTGTLNGIATAKDTGVHVAGGYILANGRKSPYSSAGPARIGPLGLREGPDCVLPCDESYALRGIRARGNRSGSVFRLIGTSAAAPQLARHIADPPIPEPSMEPASPEDYAKRGDGNVEPP